MSSADDAWVSPLFAFRAFALPQEAALRDYANALAQINGTLCADVTKTANTLDADARRLAGDGALHGSSHCARRFQAPPPSLIFLQLPCPPTSLSPSLPARRSLSSAQARASSERDALEAYLRGVVPTELDPVAARMRDATARFARHGTGMVGPSIDPSPLLPPPPRSNALQRCARLLESTAPWYH